MPCLTKPAPSCPCSLCGSWWGADGLSGDEGTCSPKLTATNCFQEYFLKHLTMQWAWQCWSELWWGGCWVCRAPSRHVDGFGCPGEGFIWSLAVLGSRCVHSQSYIPGSCVCICQLLALMDFVANSVWSQRSLTPRMCPAVLPDCLDNLPGPQGH